MGKRRYYDVDLPDWYINYQCSSNCNREPKTNHVRDYRLHFNDNKCIRDFRTDHKLTQREFATELGVVQTTISTWENGWISADWILIARHYPEFDEIAPEQIRKAVRKRCNEAFTMMREDLDISLSEASRALHGDTYSINAVHNIESGLYAINEDEIALHFPQIHEYIDKVYDEVWYKLIGQYRENSKPVTPKLRRSNRKSNVRSNINPNALFSEQIAIYEERVKRGLSAADVARMMGGKVSYSTYYLWESGVVPCDWDIVHKVFPNLKVPDVTYSRTVLNPVRRGDTGEIYKSAKFASSIVHVSPTYIKMFAHSGQPHKGVTWEYVSRSDLTNDQIRELYATGITHSLTNDSGSESLND